MMQRRRIAHGVCTGFAIAALAALVPAAGMAADDEGSTLYYSANALYNQKLYALAVGEYKAFMEKHPEHAKITDARYGLALCYFALGKHAEAEPELETVIEAGTIGDTNQLHLMLGQCRLRLDKAAEAEKEFARLASGEEPGPYTEAALAGLAEAQFRQKKWGPTVETTDRILASEPDKTLLVRGLYQGGYARHQMKQYEEAVPIFERLLDEDIAEALKLQASFLLAECYRETGDLAKAAENYAAATGLPGSEHEVLYRLGVVRFMQEDYDGAVSALRQSLADAPDSAFAANARIYIARALIEQKDFAAAVELLEPAEGAGEPDDEASLWLARAYTLQKNPARAAEILKGAVARFPQSRISRELMFDLANAQIAAREFEPAAELLSTLVEDKEWAQNADVIRLYAVCLHKTGDFEKSLGYADRFLKTAKNDPAMPDIVFLVAENFYLSEKLDAALTVYKKFVTRYPAHASIDAATLRMAQVHYRENRWEEALDLALPLAEKKPAGKVFSDLDFLIGDCLFRLEKWDGAIDALTRFLARHPADDPRIDTALVELGASEARRGNNEEAARHFTRLVEQYADSPHGAVAYAELGRINYEAGQYASAREAMERCLELYPEGAQAPKAKYYLGWIALKGQNDEEALKRFQALVADHPQHKLSADAALQLGLLQVGAEQYGAAKKTLGAFVAANPEHDEAVAATYTLGVAQARSGDAQQAVEQFQKVVGDHPKSDYADRALYELAWCYKDLKNNKEAVRQYEALLANYPASPLATRARVELAELTFDAKDYDKVIAELETTLAELTDDNLREQTLYRLGSAYFNKGVFAKSAKAFEDMAAEFPDSRLLASATYQAGESRLKLGETEAAREHFLAVTGMEPDADIMESALMRLGETESLTKRWEEASGTYGAFLEQFPDSKWTARARFGYAFALERQGKHDAALPEYRKIVARKSKDDLGVRSQFQIGECLFALKKYDEAIRELVRVTVNFGDTEWSAKALLETGRILEAKGDRAGAIEQFRTVIEKYPDRNVAVVAKQRLDALRRNK